MSNFVKKVYQSFKGTWKYFYDEKLKFIDEIEEKLSIKLQQYQTNYEYSFAQQRKMTYIKIIVRYVIAGMLVTQLSLFYTDIINEPNRPVDASIELLQITNNLSERTYFAFDDIIKQGQDFGTLDPSTYCVLGNLLSQINESELSQTAYYFAHLKNHKEIKANSDLQFDTVTKQKMGGFDGQ